MTRICTGCKTEYPATLEYFYFHELGKGELTSQCKKCCIATRQKYQRTERGKKSCNKAVKKYTLKKYFNMTLVDYDRMLESQNEVCAICGKTNKNGQRLSVDHDHQTGKVRALLCQKCNGVLGYVNDNIAILLKLVEYIKEHKS